VNFILIILFIYIAPHCECRARRF